MAAEEVSPPWGSFPAEQYLIRHWDSSLNPDDHHRQLVRDFLALSEIPKEWDTTGREMVEPYSMSRRPTPSEIQNILKPWRPLRWRNAAFRIWKDRSDEAIWARTDYSSPEDDDKFKEWLAVQEDTDPSFDADTLSWCFLDDPDTFLFNDDGGDAWQRVLYLMPEIAGPHQGYSRLGRKSKFREKWLGMINDAANPREEAERGVGGSELQTLCVSSILLVADRESWETEKLRLIFLDAKGNSVRESRIKPEDVYIVEDQWSRFRLDECGWWNLEGDPYCEGGTLGDAYRVDGTEGRHLYGIPYIVHR